jgi:D-glutamate cyclase
MQLEGDDEAHAAFCEATGDLLDRIITLDLKRRGAVEMLYQAARARAKRSLSMHAASVLSRAVTRGDTVLFTTGFPVRPWISPAIGETDGPPGVAALARALAIGCGAIPVVLVPEAMRGQAVGALRAGGLLVLDLEEARRVHLNDRPTCVACVAAFPTNAALASDAAERMLQVYRPAAVAAVEHPGCNAANVYHSSVGVDISAGTAKVEPLFEGARRQGIATLSFIDMPNEIGAGSLRQAVEGKMAFASQCACPCGGGTAAASEVDVLVVGATVNWASYATAAALSVLLDDPDIVFTRNQDARAMEAVQMAGGVEGVSGSVLPSAGVDGIPADVSGNVADLLHFVAKDAREARFRKPF